jgi:hypothetical protein
VVNANAWYSGFTWDGMIHKITPKQWNAMLAVHCTAPFRLIQAAAPVMREAAKKELDQHGEAKQRCIINISSTSGTHGNAGQANYSTVGFPPFIVSSLPINWPACHAHSQLSPSVCLIHGICWCIATHSSSSCSWRQMLQSCTQAAVTIECVVTLYASRQRLVLWV